MFKNPSCSPEGQSSVSSTLRQLPTRQLPITKTRGVSGLRKHLTSCEHSHIQKEIFLKLHVISEWSAVNRYLLPSQSNPFLTHPTISSFSNFSCYVQKSDLILETWKILPSKLSKTLICPKGKFCAKQLFLTREEFLRGLQNLTTQMPPKLHTK